MNKDFTKDIAVLVPGLDLSSLKKQNKDKVWTDRIINLKVDDKGNFIHNAEDITKAVKSGIEVLENNIKTTNSLDDLALWKSNLKVLIDWISGTRLESTSIMDNLKKELIIPEQLLKKMNDPLKEKEDELNEKIYMIRKSSIIDYFETLSKELEFEIDLNVFDSFCDLKKKTKVFDLNKSEKLSAAAIKQIEDEFKKFVDPIIEEKRLNAIIEKEQKFLTKELSLILTSGTNEILEKSLIALDKIKMSIDTDYSSLKEYANMQINNTIDLVNNSILNNKRFEKQTIQNEKDIKFLNSLDEIDMDSKVISYLELMLQSIEKYEDLDNMIPSNRDKANKKIAALDGLILELRRFEMNKKAPIKKETPKVENVPTISTEKSYKLSSDTIELLSELTAYANNEDEAKENIINSIRAILDMEGLENE